MCETQSASVPKGNMSIELFRWIVEDLKRIQVRGIALHNVNEPILHRRIFDFLNHLEDSRLHVFLSSNGQALDRFAERARRQARLPRRLEFRYSIDGGTEETYEEMRKGGDFEKLIANFARTQDFCDARGIKYLPSCNYILTRKTAREVADYYRRFRRFFALENTSFCFLHGHPVLGVTDFIQANALSPLALSLPCRTPFETMSVHHDGKVSLCCIDYNQEGIVGHCPTDALDSI